MTQPPTMNTREIAAAFGQPIDWWYRNKNKLMAAGFPKPIPGIGNLWSSKLVMEFINRQPSAENQPEPANDQSGDEWEQRLLSRIPGAVSRAARRQRQP